jgi:hypothetical protein
MGGIASVLYGAIASRLRHDPARRGMEMLPPSPAQDRGRSIAQSQWDSIISTSKMGTGSFRCPGSVMHPQI